ncbi:MAG: HEAT repeat domain-containing protein [Bacteroidota bacterium]|nr:HEAT repeat domain-containing protein [Bacteroidota bacterium]
MKTLLYRMMNVSLTAVAALLLTAGTATVNAQTVFENTKVVKSHGIPSLTLGVKSDNEGLKRSSIYFAGQYKIVEMVKPLTEQLRRENDASVRVLIALSLFEIGTPESMDAIKSLAAFDKNDRVRNISNSILTNYNRNIVTSTK